MIARRIGWLAGGLAAALFALTALAAPAFAGKEQAKDLDKIPKAVMDALKAKFPGAKITKWTKETEDGKLVYDIEFTQNGKKAEADIAPDGTIQNYEREFDAKNLPKAVTEAVAKRYPGAKMKEVMEITDIKAGKEVHGGFEITLQTADNRNVEVTVARDGKILEDTGAKKEKEQK
jgi:uncharacterized membrane protein YkoI